MTQDFAYRDKGGTEEVMRIKTITALAALLLLGNYALVIAPVDRANAQEQLVEFGMVRGWMLTDGRNVAVNAAAVGFGNKVQSYEAAMRLVTRVSNFNDDINVAFWPPTVCGQQATHDICTLARVPLVPFGARVTVQRQTPSPLLPVAQQ
ncbi:MAG: hypothetical protein WC050_01085 [Candidatus Paceibacterota bacterium]